MAKNHVRSEILKIYVGGLFGYMYLISRCSTEYRHPDIL